MPQFPTLKSSPTVRPRLFPSQTERAETDRGLVCVVDLDVKIRNVLTRLFRSAELQVETYGTAHDYLQRNGHDGPKCLVIGVHPPHLDGLELQETLASREEQIIFITGQGNVSICAKAMKAGAVDFLTKPVDHEELLEAVRRALLRSSQIRRLVAERVSARNRIDSLTPREFEVMRHVIAGMLNKQIAGALGVAEKTVKIHRGRVMEKMGVKSVADLVRLSQTARVEPAGFNTEKES